MELIFIHQGEFNSSFFDVDSEAKRICALLKCSCPAVTQKLLFIMDYTLRELFNNAVEHGNGLQSSRMVKYQLRFTGEFLEISVADEGNGFVLPPENKEVTSEMGLSERNRGLSSLKTIGFELNINRNGINVRLDIRNSDYWEERENNTMKITCKDNMVYCNVNTSLVSMNIKELVSQFKTALGAMDGYQIVQVDLSQSESIDSMGITFLIGLYKELSAQGKKVRLTGVSDAMLQLFKILKLDEIFEIINA